MRVPRDIQPLVDDGLVDEVLRELMSGKEAKLYIVRSGSEIRCAKVYKNASQRSFKKAVQYQEGRKVRNSRRGRAMEKGSRFGRTQTEEVWQTAELNALQTLARADVRVPQPYGCFDGVLLMELITDAEGNAAPRLNDITMSAKQACKDHALMMRYVVRMLCAGVIHGDLSEFNVLMEEAGPVVIDLPQAVDAAANNNARSMLLRDVNNISNYYGRFAPELKGKRHAKEIWSKYEGGTLDPDFDATGVFKESTKAADVDGVLQEVNEAAAENEERMKRLGIFRESA